MRVRGPARRTTAPTPRHTVVGIRDGFSCASEASMGNNLWLGDAPTFQAGGDGVAHLMLSFMFSTAKRLTREKSNTCWHTAPHVCARLGGLTPALGILNQWAARPA